MVVALLVLPAALPGGAPAHAGDPDQLDRIEAEIRQKRKLIERAEDRERGLLASLADSDERRGQVSARVADLAASLSAAEERLGLARSDLRAGRRQLRRWGARLEAEEAK